MDDTPGKPGSTEEEDPGGQADGVVPTRGDSLLPVMGIGGSAGAIAALRTFFEALPPDTGVAFVVVLHLAPEHDSILAELLQKCTRMPVTQVEQRCLLEPDRVYVVPPRKVLRMRDGFLQPQDLPARHTRHLAVDVFFRSLADTHGPHATAVVLSGMDGDGASGIKRIKERGGLTIAQDPGQAEHSGMPNSAIATGMVDWILPVQDIPAKFLEYRRLESRLRLPPEHGPAAAPADEEALRQVMDFMHTRTGRDFSGYKRATVLRRLGRRMQVNGEETLADYLACLRTRPGETGALLQEMLVSVTNFFRDAACFAALEAQIPALLRGKGPADAVRVWVVACATGEEAYSIAMLLLEHTRQLEAPPLIQVFATDLDQDALRSAREGRYPAAIEGDVSEERLRLFFLRDHQGYQVRREVRETVLFAAHDVLRDAPFSRVDVLTCRNLLIYLNREAQRRALETFGFALLPGGLLFLGASESVEEGGELFTVVDKKHRLYAQRGGPHPGIGGAPPSDPAILALTRQAQQAARTGPVLSAAAFARMPQAAPGGPPRARAAAGSWAELHFGLLELIAPPSILVDSAGDIVHLSATAGRYLHHAGGEPSRSLLRAVQPGLRAHLRAALYEAEQTDAPVELDGLPLPVRLRIVPLGQAAPGFMLVLLQPASTVAIAGDATEDPAQAAQEPFTQQLEREIERLRLHLGETVEQYELSAEELKASNEELQAINEEMRSATEELETSREELQSINEELGTVNLELSTKVEELGHSNADLHNLMGATAIATLFLDRELRITRFTPAAVGLFTLIAADIGRPLSNLATHLHYPELEDDARRVLQHLAPAEREVGADGGRCFLARTLPYRTLDDHIAGVVLAFVDITERKQGQEALRDSEERLRLIVENAVEYAIFSTDPQRGVTSWNTGAERLLGYTEAEAMGRPADIIFTPEDRLAGAPQQEVDTALREGRAGDDRFHQRKDGSTFWASGALMPMYGDPGAQGGAGGLHGFVKILRDQSSARQAQGELEQSRVELEAALEEQARSRAALEAADAAKDRFLAVLSHELRNPLASIHGAAQVLQSDAPDPQERRRAVHIVQRQAGLMKILLDDLLDISRLSLGRLVLRCRPVGLDAVVQAAVEATRPAIDASGHRLAVSLPPHAPELRADRVRLTQVLSNLLMNAAKYTPPGGQIALGAWVEDETAVFEVSDSGIGIEPARMESMFEMFTQDASGAAAAAHGLGIGLALVRSIVELHGGTVAGHSEGPGRGSRFTVRLPRGDVRAPEPVPDEPRAAVPAAPAARCRVLIADDNADAAWGLGKALELEGWEVFTADGGGAAIEQAQRVRPDVAVLDIGMPDMSGHDVARHLRAQPWGQSMLLVAATGWGQEADRVAAAKAGFDAHLAKPVDLPELRRLVQGHCMAKATAAAADARPAAREDDGP